MQDENNAPIVETTQAENEVAGGELENQATQEGQDIQGETTQETTEGENAVVDNQEGNEAEPTDPAEGDDGASTDDPQDAVQTIEAQEPAQDETAEAMRIYKAYKENKEEFVKNELLKDEDARKIVEREVAMRNTEVIAEQKINEALKEISETQKAIKEITDYDWTQEDFMIEQRTQIEKIYELKSKLKVLKDNYDDNTTEYSEIEAALEKEQRYLDTVQKIAELYSKVSKADKIYKQAYEEKQKVLVKQEAQRKLEIINKDPVFKEIGVKDIYALGDILQKEAFNMANGNTEKATVFYDTYCAKAESLLSIQDPKEKAKQLKEYISAISSEYRSKLISNQKNKAVGMKDNIMQKIQNKPTNPSPKAGGVEGEIDKAEDYIFGKISPNLFKQQR